MMTTLARIPLFGIALHLFINAPLSHEEPLFDYELVRGCVIYDIYLYRIYDVFFYHFLCHFGTDLHTKKFEKFEKFWHGFTPKIVSAREEMMNLKKIEPKTHIKTF